MSLAKKILTYVLLLAVLGAVIILFSAAYLILVPNSEVFGYHYVAGNSVETNHLESLGLTEYENVVVESLGFNVTLEPQTERANEVMISMVRGATSFTKEAIHQFHYSYAYTADTKTITIRVVAPTDGFTFYTLAQIRIGLPNVLAPKNITIISKGGEVTLGAEKPTSGSAPKLEATSITIKNTRANILLQNFSTTATGTLTIENISGRTSILGDVGVYNQTTKAGNVVLKSRIGSFTFGDSTTKYNIGGDLLIDAVNAFIDGGNVGGNVTHTHENGSGFIKLGIINKALYVETENGEVEVGTVLEEVTIISAFNTIKIGTIGKPNYLGPVLPEVVIQSTNGNIEIDTCYYDLIASSKRGNIKVNNAFSTLNITTTYGDVTVNYNENADPIKSYDTQNQPIYKTLSVVTTEGDITATNLKTITTLKVSSGGTAKIEARFIEVRGENKIEAGRRESTIYVPIANFNFELLTINGGINMSAANHYKTNWSSNDYRDGIKKYSTGTLSMANGSSINTLTISSTAGKINFYNN